MPEPLLLYSANTWLAWKVAKDYYGDAHYVWCSRYFDSGSLPAVSGAVPPTSCAGDIYRSLWDEVRAGDRHSAKIAANKVGILKGATTKRVSNLINGQQEQDIIDIVGSAECRDFRPLLFVAPYAKVKNLVSIVPPNLRAHPAWEEYIIAALPGKHFDIIEFMR